MNLTEEKNIIFNHFTIKQALEILNTLTSKSNLTLFVVNDDQKLIGALTDGDIRRGLLEGYALTQTVDSVMKRNFKYLVEKQPDINKKMEEMRILEIGLVPILDTEKRIKRIINLTEQYALIPAEAVIMAGGRGERLRPITDTIPKPLVQVGEKPIIEHNIDRLIRFGITTLHISVKYLAEKIEAYLGDGSKKNAHIQYLHENEPLGTIGALVSCKDFQEDTILVMNSDLLTNIDYADFYQTFIQEQADIAIATVPYSVTVPYAVLETDGQQVVSLKEKPTYDYQANAGIYLLKKELIQYIPPQQFFNATDLIELCLTKGHKIVTFPIVGYWLDIGRHEELRKAQEDIKHLQLHEK